MVTVDHRTPGGKRARGVDAEIQAAARLRAARRRVAADIVTRAAAGRDSAARDPELLAGEHSVAVQRIEVDDLLDNGAGVLVGIRALGH